MSKSKNSDPYMLRAYANTLRHDGYPVSAGAMDAAAERIENAEAENAKLRESDATHQKAAAYWWVQYYAAKGMSAPTPYSTDSAWEKVLEGACMAEQENAKLRECVDKLQGELDVYDSLDETGVPMRIRKQKEGGDDE